MNLGNPSRDDHPGVCKSRFARDLATACGIEFKPLPSDDPKLRRPDISKAKRVLGWEPKVALDEGLTVTIDYFKRISKRITPSPLDVTMPQAAFSQVLLVILFRPVKRLRGFNLRSDRAPELAVMLPSLAFEARAACSCSGVWKKITLRYCVPISGPCRFT